jgi:hypothetical protein
MEAAQGLDGMSTLGAAAPTSSSLKLGTVVRIVAILLGVASAVLLAHSAFGIRFNENFLLFLKLLENAIGTIVLPFELLIVKPVMRWFHQQGWVFELHDHWRNVFVLLWLYFDRNARAMVPPSVLRRLSDAGMNNVLRFKLILSVALYWALLVFAALFGAIFAGSVPIGHPSVLWWPVAAFFLHLAAYIFIFLALWNRYTLLHFALDLIFAGTFALLALGWLGVPAFASPAALYWWPMASWFAMLAGLSLIPRAFGQKTDLGVSYGVVSAVLAAASLALALGALAVPAWLVFEHARSPGLANLATFVTLLSVWQLVDHLIWFDDQKGWLVPPVRAALDVLTVLGGAAIIVYLAHLMA